MRENHYAISCIVLKISYVFNKQDEHNASYFPKCRDRQESISRKVNNNIWD